MFPLLLKTENSFAIANYSCHTHRIHVYITFTHIYHTKSTIHVYANIPVPWTVWVRFHLDRFCLMVNFPECHTLGSPVPSLSAKLGSKTSYKWGEISSPRSRLRIPVAHVYMATHIGESTSNYVVTFLSTNIGGHDSSLKGSLKHPKGLLHPMSNCLFHETILCFPINLSPFVPRLSSEKPTKEVLRVDRCCGLRCLHRIGPQGTPPVGSEHASGSTWLITMVSKSLKYSFVGGLLMANQPTSLSCAPLKQIDGLKKASLTET